MICVSAQPFLDASRVLLEGGADPTTVLTMVHANAPTTIALKGPIGVAAQFDVMGARFVRRKGVTKRYAEPKDAEGRRSRCPTSGWRQCEPAGSA